MKNLLLLILLIISTSSCGVFNQASRKDNGSQNKACMKRVKVEKDKCEIQSEATSEGLRVYGVGVSINPLEAREKAMLSAKMRIESLLKKNLLQKIKLDNKKRTADFKEKHKFN